MSFYIYTIYIIVVARSCCQGSRPPAPKISTEESLVYAQGFDLPYVRGALTSYEGQLDIIQRLPRVRQKFHGLCRKIPRENFNGPKKIQREKFCFT